MLLILFKNRTLEKQNLICPIDIKRRTEVAKDITVKVGRVLTRAKEELNL